MSYTMPREAGKNNVRSGTACARRIAGDDVSIHTNRRKQESMSAEQTKGMTEGRERRTKERKEKGTDIPLASAEFAAAQCTEDRVG
jgi:hypothetical protein